MIQGITNGILAPADAEMIIEGYFDELGYREQEENRMENSGAITGRVHMDPVFHVTAIEKLNAATRKAITDPAVIKRFHDAGIYPSASTPERLTELIRSDAKRWARVIKAVGYRLE